MTIDPPKPFWPPKQIEIYARKVLARPLPIEDQQIAPSLRDRRPVRQWGLRLAELLAIVGAARRIARRLLARFRNLKLRTRVSGAKQKTNVASATALPHIADPRRLALASIRALGATPARENSDAATVEPPRKSARLSAANLLDAD